MPQRFDVPIEKASATLLVRPPLRLDSVDGYEVVVGGDDAWDCELVSPFELIDRGAPTHSAHSVSGFKNHLLVLGFVDGRGSMDPRSTVLLVDRGVEPLFRCLCWARDVPTAAMRLTRDFSALDDPSSCVVVASTMTLQTVLDRLSDPLKERLFLFYPSSSDDAKVAVTFPFVRSETIAVPPALRRRSSADVMRSLTFHMVVICEDANLLRNPRPFRGQGRQTVRLRDHVLGSEKNEKGGGGGAFFKCSGKQTFEEEIKLRDFSMKAFVKRIEIDLPEKACRVAPGRRFVLANQTHAALENDAYRVTHLFESGDRRWIAATNAPALPSALEDLRRWNVVDAFSKDLHVYEAPGSGAAALQVGDAFCDDPENPRVRYKVVQTMPALRVLEDVDPGKRNSKCHADDATSCLMGYADQVAFERDDDGRCAFHSDCPFFLKGLKQRPYRGGCLADRRCELPIGADDAAPYCAGCPSHVHPTECCVLQGPASARYAYA